MTTPTPDSSPPHGRSWRELTERARSEMPPPGIDVRTGVMAAIRSAPRRKFEAPVPGLIDDLLSLAGLSWMRATLVCGTAAGIVLLLFGTSALRELNGVTEFAGPLFAGL